MTVKSSICVVLFIILGGTSCYREETVDASGSTEASQEPLIFTAEIEQVSQRSWPIIVRSQGSLIADEVSTIGAKVSGRVAITSVDLGSRVKKNEELVHLELTDFDLQVQQVEAELAEACAKVGLQPNDPVEKLDPQVVPTVMVAKAIRDEAQEAMARMKRLQNSRAISASEFNKQKSAERVADANYQSALQSVDEQLAIIRVRRAALAMTRQNREDAIIRASFDGVIQRRHVSAGAIVRGGDPLVTLVRTNPLRFRGRVPELKANSVQLGQSLKIVVAGVPEIIHSLVQRTSPSLDESNRSLMIEGDLDNADGKLRSGLFAEADIVVDSNATTVAIPASAVGEFAGANRVWVVTDGIAAQQQVKIGRRSDEQFEILTGLRTNQWIVSDFNKGLAGRVETAKSHQLTVTHP